MPTRYHTSPTVTYKWALVIIGHDGRPQTLVRYFKRRKHADAFIYEQPPEFLSRSHDYGWIVGDVTRR